MNQLILGFSIGFGLSALYKRRQNEKELNGDIVEMIKERMEKGRKE